MICEIGLNMSKTLKGKQLPIIPITQEEFKKFTFVYNRGLQDFVMNSVKHDEGGGKNFDLLYLHNFAKPENQKPLFNILSDNLGLSKNEIAKLFSLITWCSKSGVLSGCKSFLRIYNKGIFPTKPEAVAFLKEHESFIQQNTFFGELVKPMYDIVNQISANRTKVAVKQAETLDSFEAEMAALLNGK